MLTTVLIILFVLVSILMIGVILIQQSKGGGLTGATFGGQAEAMFGGAHAGNILTKATATLAVLYAVLCIAIAISMRAGESTSSVTEQALERATSAASAFPAAGSDVQQFSPPQPAETPAGESGVPAEVPAETGTESTEEGN